MADNSDDLIISISTDLATVRRSLKRLEADIASSANKVEKQFDGMGKGIDKSMTSALQARIDKMVGIGTQGAQDWQKALEDNGKEIERLRAKYNPLFSTINNYKQSVADIRRAHSLGAISATEMTAAITKERQAALASTAAIKGRNAALADTPVQRGGGANPYTSNIAAQFQDIGVTAMGGMSPLQIALQQGTQLSSVFNDLKASGSGLGSALAASFASIVSPISLVTIGVVAASAAAIQYFSNVEWGGAKSAETLKKEAELIASVSQKWGEALPELKAYNDERERVAAGKDIAETANISANDQWADLRKTIADLRIEFADFSSLMGEAGAKLDWVDPVGDAFNKLVAGVEKGTASSREAKSVQEALMVLFEKTGLPVVKDFADQIGTLAEGLDRASGSAAKFKTQANSLISDIKVLAALSEGGMTDPVQAYRLREQLRRQEENANPTVTNPQGVTVPVPVPGQKPVQLGEDPVKNLEKEEKSTDKVKKAYEDLLKSSDDRLAAMKLELTLTGQYGAATDAARYRLQLLQDVRQAGKTIGAEETADVEKRVKAYETYSNALAEAQLQQDLLTDARMRGMSAQDQKIVQTQRQYGLPEDPSSQTGQAIAKSLQLDEIKSASDQFIDSLSSALLSGGGDIGKKLGQVVLDALLDSAQKQVSGILKQLFSSLFTGAPATSAAGVASVASQAASYAAPVGAVTRAPLPDIGSYAKAIQAIESGGNYGALGPITRNGDRAYGAYQVMGNNIPSWSKAALGRSMTPDQFLGDKAAQDAVFSHRFGGYADKFGASGAAQAWFGGPGSVGKGGAGADILGTTGSAYVNKFNTQLSKMGDVAKSTAQGLGGLDTGLNAITKNFGAGQGLGNIIGGFDWSNVLSSSFTPNTTLSSVLGLASGGRVVGPGTSTSDSIPAMLSNGEHVTRAAMVAKHGPLLDAINADKIPRFADGGFVRRVGAPVAPRLNRRAPMGGVGGAPRDLNVNISGASGDPHVRELVRQGVQEAMRADREAQRRGTFGAMQSKFASQKG